MGARQAQRTTSCIDYHFNPRAPHGGATSGSRQAVRSADISIHAPRMGARRFALHTIQRAADISIHAPRMGARRFIAIHPTCNQQISIHAPRMGARLPRKAKRPCRMAFQSTRPAWGRDQTEAGRACRSHHFNPRAPHGGATAAIALLCRDHVISIHAPRMGARLYSFMTLPPRP